MADRKGCGVIVKRGKGFGVSVYDPALKRKRWVGTFATRTEAREAERETSRRRHVGGRLTCGEFAKLWLVEYPRKAGATQRSYRYALLKFPRFFGHPAVAPVS